MHAELDRAVFPGAASNSAPVVLEASAGTVPAAAITVMIASDREALHATWLPMLASEAGIEVKHEPAMGASHLANCVEHHLPRVLLLDKALLDTLDPQSLQRIHQHCPQVRVLVLWDEICHGLVADVLRNRFHGFLLTMSPPDICLKAIRAVCNGELWLSRESLAMALADLLRLPPLENLGASVDSPRTDDEEALTPREVQVVELLRRGCINKEIARELGIMEDTVKKHLQSVFAKLGVHRRALVALRSLPGYGATHFIR